jgi:hypothetical protein
VPSNTTIADSMNIDTGRWIAMRGMDMAIY